MRVKICGVTSVEDALGCAEAGADAIGLNFWAGSRRRCELAVARRIVEALVDRARVVAVVVDAPVDAVERLRGETGVAWVQLHGDEPAHVLSALSPEAYKAVRVGGPEDVAAADAFRGDELLVDARVEGLVGGTGARADWVSAAVLARRRRIWLAGGLTPDNVADAIRAVRPYGVDVASGVERAPGIKDLAQVRRFVAASRPET